MFMLRFFFILLIRHDFCMCAPSSCARFQTKIAETASLDGRARGCASGVSNSTNYNARHSLTLLSHLGSPDNLAFMYSPIVLTLTEGFARGGAHVVYGSTGERNGISTDTVLL